MNEYTVVSLHDSLVIEPTVLKAWGQTRAGLFVINVCASKAPLTLVNAPGGFRSYKFYQVSRVENGIRHYRLRLGFFVTPTEAEIALARIRERFPSAFISRLIETSGRRSAQAKPVVLADSTQTVRALTQPELDNPNQPAWYAVQLAQSDQPPNLEAMPRLDVFAAYSLYSVTQPGPFRHALRLGFFREEVSANALCGYLKTFFSAPSVVRVSVAEQARFDNPLHRKPQTRRSTSPDAKVVYLSSAREPSVQPAVVPQMKVVTLQAAPVSKQSSQPKPTATTPAKAPIKKRKSLAEELIEEARQIQMAQTGVHRIPARSGSWLSRLVSRPK